MTIILILFGVVFLVLALAISYILIMFEIVDEEMKNEE